MIRVKKENGGKFRVVIEEKGFTTQHLVSLDDGYYEELTQGKISKEELIRSSFTFLLEREPKESILTRFDLKVINHYFPDFEEKIRETL